MACHLKLFTISVSGVRLLAIIDNPDSSVRLPQKSQNMYLLLVRLCGNLGPQKLNFDVSLLRRNVI